MKVRVRKWGNSLAVRLPKTIAGESDWNEGSMVDIRAVRGKLVIAPVKQVQYTLDALLDGVTPANIHDEWKTGSPRGKEI